MIPPNLDLIPSSSAIVRSVSRRAPAALPPTSPSPCPSPPACAAPCVRSVVLCAMGSPRAPGTNMNVSTPLLGSGSARIVSRSTAASSSPGPSLGSCTAALVPDRRAVALVPGRELALLLGREGLLESSAFASVASCAVSVLLWVGDGAGPAGLTDEAVPGREEALPGREDAASCPLPLPPPTKAATGETVAGT